MKLVYLDQNKWIQLARACHGKAKDQLARTVADFMRLVRDQGHHRYPLSAGHYIETSKQRDRARARRLASVMIEFSRLDTMATPMNIVRMELEKALARRFPDKVTPREFELTGKGIGHITNSPREFRLDDPEELAALAGRDAASSAILAAESAKYDEAFMRFLESLPKDFSDYPPERQQRIALGHALQDIKAAIEDVLEHHKLADQMPEWSAADPLNSNLPEWGEIIHEMPSRRVEMQMVLQFARDPSLRPKPGDLRDFFYLGPAAAHCDVVVCEKQFADLVNRGQLAKKATVVSDLEEILRH